MIADLTVAEGKFYCSGDYVYYLNESNFLLKRSLSSKSDTPLWNIPCVPIGVFGETVVCENSIIVKNSKEVGISSGADNFKTYYDGQILALDV